MMPSKIAAIGFFALLGILAGCAPAGTLDQTAAAAPADPRARFDRMARFISSARQFQVTVRMGYDVLQESGQKIEFNERHRITIARPDRLRAEILKSNGEHGMVQFDGQTILAYNAAHEVYAQAEKPGSLDEVLAYFLDDLNMRLPLALMFMSTFPDEMEKLIEELAFVEVSAVTDTPCLHLAGRTAETDFQIWIPETGDPLPKRLTITYRDETGQPKFWADFESWDMAPTISAKAFTFTPPADAERIPFLVEIEKALGDDDPKGGN